MFNFKENAPSKILKTDEALAFAKRYVAEETITGCIDILKEIQVKLVGYGPGTHDQKTSLTICELIVVKWNILENLADNTRFPFAGSCQMLSSQGELVSDKLEKPEPEAPPAPATSTAN